MPRERCHFFKPCMLKHKLVPFRLRAVPGEFHLRSVERTCFIQHFCDDQTSHNKRSTVNRNNEALDWRMSCSGIQITRRWSKTSPLSQQNLLAPSSLKIIKRKILQFLNPVYTGDFLALFQTCFQIACLDKWRGFQGALMLLNRSFWCSRKSGSGVV